MLRLALPRTKRNGGFQPTNHLLAGRQRSTEGCGLRAPGQSDPISGMSSDASTAGLKPTVPTADERRPLPRFLLTALAGLLLLAAVTLGFFPPAAHRPGSAKFRSAQTGILTVHLSNSIKAYYTQYSSYPLPASFIGSESTVWRSDAPFTAALMGTDTGLNPRKIKFLPELRRVTVGRNGGLKPTDAGLAVVDAWGEPFYVLLDADYSGEMENPDPTAERRRLAQGVLVFSAGPDKDPSTWEDNVTSWTARPHR